MTNTETTAATWVALLAGRPDVSVGPRLRSHFEAGRITRLCECGCHSFDLEIPAAVHLEPLGGPGAPGKLAEIAFESSADAEIAFTIFVDSRGYLSGIDVTCGTANHATVPDDVRLGQVVRVGEWFRAGSAANLNTWTCAAVLGLVIGAVAGAGAMLLPWPPMLHTLVAVLVALLLSEVVMWLLVFRYPALFGDPGVGSFGWGPENLLYLGGLVALGGVLHVTLGVLGGVPWVGEYRAVVLGTAAGLYGAFSVARTLTVVSKAVQAEHRRHTAPSR